MDGKEVKIPYVSRDEFDRQREKLLTEDAWMIAGDYSRTYERRIRAAIQLFFWIIRKRSVCTALRNASGRCGRVFPGPKSRSIPGLYHLNGDIGKKTGLCCWNCLKSIRKRIVSSFIPGKKPTNGWRTCHEKIV